MNEKLEIGDKFLSISILGQINIAAFKNKGKTKLTDPDYTGQGVAVWIKEKKAPVEKIGQGI